jgi:putative transposase
MTQTDAERGLVADTFHRLVVAGGLYVDLEREIVDEARKCRVFSNASDALAYDRRPGLGDRPVPIPVKLEEGERVSWDGHVWEIQNVGKTQISLVGEPRGDGSARATSVQHPRFQELIARGSVHGIAGPVDPRLLEARARRKKAGPDQQAAASTRFAVIRPVLDGEARAADLTRNQKRWLSGYRKAELDCLDGFTGLYPAVPAGNETNHPVEVPDSAIDLAIAAVYAQPGGPSKKGFIRQILSALTAAGSKWLPSDRRIRSRLAESKTHEQDVKRLGKRLAYASEGFIWRLSMSSPPHGTRPWERAHIDHTLLDIELVDSENRDLVLGRPWLTVVVDAFTRRVLAAWLTFDDPSYRSDMMALRECVRRFNRLPQEIVADGGSDFESAYYENLLASFYVTKKTRPSAKGHFGSVIERLFGLTDQMFIHEVAGNTVATKNVRMVTPSVNPKRLAVFDLQTFSEALHVWFYDVYDNRLHPTIAATPRQAYDRGVELAGGRRTRFWNYDEDFIRLTLPTKGNGKLTIHKTKGLRLTKRRYWNEAFRRPRLNGKAVPFVFDPWDLRYIEAFVAGSWLRCDAPAFSRLPGLTERELRIATTEWMARAKAVGRTTRPSDIEIGDFLIDVASHGDELRKQRRQDAATRSFAESIGLVRSVAPVLAAASPADPLDSVGTSPVRFDPADVPIVDFGDFE